jgi:photosystem II stability/assembly factor-like uncharacterized protein
LRIFALAINPRAPGTVYAGGFGGRVFKTVDRGDHWVERRIGASVYRVTVLLVDPGDSSVPALDHQPPALYAGASGGGVFRSLDGGETWERLVGLGDVTVYALVLDPRVPHTLYAGTGDGLYKSVDRGAQWARLAGAPTGAVLSLAVDPSNPLIVYAGTPDGVAKSLDGGRRWSAGPTWEPPGAIVSLVVDPWNPSTVYAGRFGDGVLGSRDAGGGWERRVGGENRP